MLVTAMLTFAVEICATFLETATGQRIASESGVAIGGRNASHAAVTGGLAARQARGCAINVTGALRAQPIRTMKLRGTGRDVATGRLLPATATATEIGRASAAGRDGAAAST